MTINCKHGFFIVDCSVCERERRLAAAHRAGFDEAIGRAAKVCDDMTIVGRAWTHDQEVAASALGSAALNIRSLTPQPDREAVESRQARPTERDPHFLAALDAVEREIDAVYWTHGDREVARRILARLRRAP
jgi:hypothetical protein